MKGDQKNEGKYLQEVQNQENSQFNFKITAGKYNSDRKKTHSQPINNNR